MLAASLPITEDLSSCARTNAGATSYTPPHPRVLGGQRHVALVPWHCGRERLQVGLDPRAAAESEPAIVSAPEPILSLRRRDPDQVRRLISAPEGTPVGPG